jgi:hypothetical protein
MRALLMHPDRDFEPPEPRSRYPRPRNGDVPPEWSPHDQALMQDLELDTLLRAMAGEDEFLLDVARQAILTGVRNDSATILYRQEVLRDCLKNPAVVRELYDLAVETIEGRRRRWLGILSPSPSGILSEALDLLRLSVDALRSLRRIAEAHVGQFESRGLTTLSAALLTELSDEYFAAVQDCLTALEFRRGVLLSAELGSGNAGSHYVLRQPLSPRPRGLQRLLGPRPPGSTVRIDPRDEAGARILWEMRNRGINLVANAVAQSAEHLRGFFELLRAETAFYVGCLNLRDTLARLRSPICVPHLEPSGQRRLRFSGLYDPCLALTKGSSVVGNALNADGKSLLIITGANQGGKSTFLRSVGLAQLMMQCGMFVAAESFAAEPVAGLFTHYKREEDATMKSGKLDEELSRMSEIADALTPNSLVLFNESFGATNEREGSEIARQVIGALLERRVKIGFVTHLYDFAHSVLDRKSEDAVFLRAEREADGTRTFRLVEGEPLETSYGEDLYRSLFPTDGEDVSSGRSRPT